VFGSATVAGVAGAKNGSDKRGGREPLEASSSTVAYLTYEPGAKGGFGFPEEPAEAFFDDGSRRFDTTELEIAKNGRIIYNSIPLPGGKPYVIKHVSEGLYRPRGAVINFEVGEENGQGLEEGRYRATVREDVQLYEKGGFLDWSVSRVDLFSRPGMEYLGPSLVVIWDEDGEENDEPGVRTDSPDLDEIPDPPDEVLAADTFSDLESAAERLMAADVPTPGGT
jgi:hypothetical protein